MADKPGNQTNQVIVMKDSFQPDEAAMLADVIEHLEWHVDHSSSRRIGFAEYRHCRMLLEMVEELENHLDGLQQYT